MSGQPYKKITDVNKFRNEYLDALNMRASIDDMNLQANKNYKATGSLPAVSQMKDSRTTSEILADTEKLKIDIMTALSKISNPQFAAAVVQRIMSSPINQDNSLLIFTAQRVNDLVEKLGRIYAYGIKGDTNDVQQIVNFLVSMYNDKNILASTTQDFLNRYNGPNYGSFGRSSSDALQNSKSILIKAKGTINSLYNLINHLHAEGIKGNIQTTQKGIDMLEAHMNKMFSIDVLMDILIRLIPEQNIISYIDQSVSGIIDNGIDPSEQTMAKILAYKDFLSFGIPSSANISLTEKKLITIVQTLQDIINKRIYSGLYPLMTNITNALDNFESILTPSENWDAETLNKLNTEVITLLKDIQQANDMEEAENSSVTSGSNNNRPTITTQQPNQQPNQSKGYMSELLSDITSSRLPPDINDIDEPATITIDEFLNPSEGYIDIAKKFIVDRIPDYGSYVDYLNPTDIFNIIRNRMPEYTAYANEILRDIRPPYKPKLKTEFDTGEPRYDLMYNQQPDVEMGGLSDTIGLRRRYTGNGIKQQQRKRGRPKGSGLQRKYSEVVKSSTATDKGIDEDRRFIKFGKYLINNKKLNDGVLAVKRPSGNNIIEFPTQHITSNFKNVIKTMIGGGMPKYEELDRLSEAEKTYLHKLASKANIIDKFSIPAPSKSNHEKDIHDFEVMKGEIMSGNDNNDLIKKFKLHILKLSKTGALPKREVMELLETLLELGF
jgi:hypothetical protein